MTSGMECFDAVVRYLNKRVDAEEKIASIIKDLTPEKCDLNDPIISTINEDLQVEIGQHLRLANDMRLLLVEPLKKFSKLQKDNQTSIDKLLSKQLKDIGKAIKEVDSAQKDLDSEQTRLSTTKPEKKAAQQAKIAKCSNDLKDRYQKAEALAEQSKRDQMELIKGSFSDFDSKRLKSMSDNILVFTQLKSRYADSIKGSFTKVQNKMNKFDASDRSKRFVHNTFDPNSTFVGENEDIYGVALFDYVSDEPQDLEFVRGDRIKVLLQHSSGWWDGELDGKKGTFPSSFVDIVGKAKDESSSVNATLLCISDYKASRPGELNLLAGDFVYVQRTEKGYGLGKNLRTEDTGSFPMRVLEIKAD